MTVMRSIIITGWLVGLTSLGGVSLVQGAPASQPAGPAVTPQPAPQPAQDLYLLSLYKPLVFLLVVGAWAWVISKFDKDLQQHFLPRQMWNGIQIGAGVLAILAWLLIPLFWIGLPLAVLIMGGGLFGYIAFRNAKVPEKLRWTASLSSFGAKMDKAQQASAQKKAAIRLMGARWEKVEMPTGDQPFAEAHAKLEDILEFALLRKAERLDIAVAGTQQVAVVVHIDGAKYPQQGIDGKTAVALIDYLKTNSKLDVADRRRKQSGQVNLDAGDYGRHTLGLQTAGSTRELTMSLHIDPSQHFSTDISELGLLEAQRQQLEPALRKGRRVVLVACPPRMGMTATLYSFLHLHDPYTQSVVTLEDDIAYEMEGVHHNELEPGLDSEAMSQKMSLTLRQDPAVVMLSRLTDIQTAKVMAKAAREVRCYVGLRQDDTFTAMRTWIKAVGDPKLGADSLAAVVAQRLVRKLCTTCRVAYKPDPEALRKLNLPADRVGQLYKHSGHVLVKNKPQPCPDCLGVAYRGRVGVFEVMVLDDQARALITAGQLDQLRSYLRKQKMLWLQEAALARVVDGSTSISEVQRVLAKEAEKQPAETA